MKKFIKKISNPLKVLIISAVVIIGTNYALGAGAWTPPTQNPPGGNVAAPINTSVDGQIKDGGLSVGYAAGVPIGFTVRNGNSGFGNINPQEKVDITGKVRIDTINKGANKVLVSDVAGSGDWLTMAELCARPGVVCGTGTGSNYWSITSGNVNDIYNNLGGRVGVGRSDPYAKLDIKGTGGTSIDLRVNGRVQSTGTGGTGGGIWVNGDATGLLGSGTQFFGNQDATHMGLFNGTWRMIVDNTGNVGIGTLTPGAPLSFGSTLSSKIYLYELNGDTGSYGLGIKSAELNVFAGTSGNINFRTNGPNGASKMYIDNNGNISFPGGTTSGSVTNTQLSFPGGNYISSDYNTSDSNLSNIYMGTHAGLIVGYPGTVLFSVDHSGNTLANGYYYSSDERLKKNILPLQNSLSKIMQLKGVSFDWKKDGSHNVGLIAQDVEKVYPELVKTDEKTGMKSVEYGNLVAPLIEAMKEQQKQIEELKDEINVLKQNK